MKLKILNTIGKVYTKEAKAILNKVGRVDCLDLNQKQLLKIIPRYDAVVCGLSLDFNRLALSQARRLKILATATTGLDHIDVGYAQKMGIEVLCLKGETKFLNTITGTAELAFGLLLDLVRYISRSFELVKNYQWDREKFRGHNLSGKILGVVGYGRLGRMMAKYGQAFGMEVLVFDPYISKLGSKVRKVGFDVLLERSDVVSIHVPLNKETENMFNKVVFKKMKTSAYLINTSRGKIVNESDLLEVLKNKQIAGYATDVLADELSFGKTFSRHPLVEYAKRHKNCVIVPHLGGMTYESREATDIFIAEKMVEWCKKNM